MKVSCILLTSNRKDKISLALRCYKNQTYENKELIVLDNGEEEVFDLLKAVPNFTYFKVPKQSLGNLRNLACDMAIGQVLCHWDDDDWSAKGRIEYQVKLLTEQKCEITGFHTLDFYDERQDRIFRYCFRGNDYACGTSLCYTREFWQRNPFKDRDIGEDNEFINPARENKQLLGVSGVGWMVARIHGRNLNKLNTSDHQWWREVPKNQVPYEFFEELMLNQTY